MKGPNYQNIHKSPLPKKESEIKSNQTEDPDLIEAQKIFERINCDLQDFLRKEFIEPQLKYEAGLIATFETLIESEECQQLKYGCLIKPLREITSNQSILKQICELNPIGFKEVYCRHFIEKKNTFRLVNCPITSMAMEFVMRRWH